MATNQCSREGLSILKNANNPLEPLLDVVLIHGFGGHPVKTWSEDGVCWPAHVKPGELSSEDTAGSESLDDKDIRVLSFGYIESIERPYEESKISGIADTLLRSLHKRRPKDLCPIVWVGHSSGGLIVKQALITAQRHRHYRDTFYSTHGVVFFATPHRAPDAVSASWDAIASRIYDATPHRIFGGKTATPQQLLTDEDCAHLDGLSSTFLDICKAETGIDLVSFEEREEHWNLQTRIVVNPGMSEPGLVHTVMESSRDHFTISRCGGDEAWDKIMDLATKSRRALAFDRIDRKALGTIDMTKIKAVQQLVEERTPGTCTWIETQDFFKAWQFCQRDGDEDRQHGRRNHVWSWGRKDKRSDQLWIYGDMGCGKTQLAAHIIDHLESNSRKSQDFIIFCSLHDIAQNYKTPETVLACLSYELLCACRPVARMWLQRRSHASTDILGWRLEQLIQLWKYLVREISRRGCRATIIIDAIDECTDPRAAGEERVKQLLQCLAESLEHGDVTEQTWRLLVLSRNTAEIRILRGSHGPQDFVSYEMSEKVTKADIAATVTVSVTEMIQRYSYNDKKLKSDMVEIIQSKAKGMYLWACVVVKEIAKQRRTPDDIRKLLSRLPTGIIGLYEMILGGIRQGDQETARIVLLWVAHQREALTESEFQTAFLLTEAAKLSGHGVRSETCLARLSDDDIKNGFCDQEKVIGCCEPLIKFAEQANGDYCLIPIHHSVLEYLQTSAEELSQKELGVVKHQPRYYYSEEHANSLISRLCTTYLLLPYFNDSGCLYSTKAEERGAWQEKVDSRVDEYPFSKYAALHWVEHGLGAGESKEERFDHSNPESDEYALLSLLDNENASVENALSWAEIWWHINGKGEDFPGRAFRHPRLPDWGFQPRTVTKQEPPPSPTPASPSPSSSAESLLRQCPPPDYPPPPPPDARPKAGRDDKNPYATAHYHETHGHSNAAWPMPSMHTPPPSFVPQGYGGYPYPYPYPYPHPQIPGRIAPEMFFFDPRYLAAMGRGEGKKPKRGFVFNWEFWWEK